MSYDNHHDWLSLIEISGPFLAVPVMKETFPQGLEELGGLKRKRLRQAYDEWRESQAQDDPQLGDLHAAWIDEVLSRGLELDENGKGDVLKRSDWCAANLKASLPQHGVTFAPDFAVVDEQRANKPLLLIQSYSQDVDLDATLKQDGWAVAPAERMVQLCRSVGCRLGLVTNGERWMLVDAPEGAVTTFASWYARLWTQEPVTLQAFVHLLGIRRFFVDESEQLPALFDRSLKFQDEVTDALGEQVRRAVEVLIQSLDKADQDRNRELLHDVPEPELYEAALTVMMRLVFLLSAEERGLLLMGDERYEANYALSTLRMQLRKESEEILERRWDAWSRLLAIFRAVFGGIEHENLRLPALGGSLFDPDRFPFLEGRAKGSNWRSDAAKPLPIDNRTVLMLLEAIQQFQGRTLSYRALDVEQIGYVYEGLLERTVKRTGEVTLELKANKSARAPWVRLAELESASLDSAERMVELLQGRTGKEAWVINALAKPVDDILADRLLTACQGDTELRDRIKPYAHLLRTDPWGYPMVYPAGSFIVTAGSDRRETGTHYTPKSLTETIVVETLTPVAYMGPAEGKLREQWALKTPTELLDLKICDPAMGSGAFLVQACRWLSDRLVEAWAQAEVMGKTVTMDGDVVDTAYSKEAMPHDGEARTLIARRLVAERCLYGVDVNPLAVELAKLSIWLVTLSKGRPFGFLDHNLRCGDSLLGITDLDQLHYLDMKVGQGSEKKLFAQEIDDAVKEAVKLRLELRQLQILDISDVEVMADLDHKAREKLELPGLIADALVGETLKSGGRKTDVTILSIEAGQVFNGEKGAYEKLRKRARASLNTDLTTGKRSRKAMHWCLEFPEVFSGGRNGFDAVVGNPPFLGGRKIRGYLGSKVFEFITNSAGENASGNADLCAFFILKASVLINPNGAMGFIATNSISEGDTRETGLEPVLGNGCNIIFAVTSAKWPGAAAITVTLLSIYGSQYQGGKILNNEKVELITPSLKKVSIAEKTHQIPENKELCFQGSVLAGKGFVLSLEEAEELVEKNPRLHDVIMPFYTGEEIFNSSTIKPKRMVINFFDRDYEESCLYSEAFSIVESKVKPVREKVRRKAHREKWWQFGDKRPALYEKLNNLDRAIVQTRHTKHLCPQIVDTGVVFSDSMVVFPSDSYWLYAILNSFIHDAWARETSGTIRTELRYSHTDCFYTFPLPPEDEELSDLGVQLDEIRCKVKKSRLCSINDVMDFINDQSDESEEVAFLREIHKRIDARMCELYGWQNFNIDHQFYRVGERDRFYISESQLADVKHQLLELNLAFTGNNTKAEKSKGEKTPVSYGRTSIKNLSLDELSEFKPQLDIFGQEGE